MKKKQNNPTKETNEKTKDSEAHYDIDGVSLSFNDDVVVSGDNQTTEGAPLPQNIFPKHRIPRSSEAKTPSRP